MEYLFNSFLNSFRRIKEELKKLEEEFKEKTKEYSQVLLVLIKRISIEGFLGSLWRFYGL